eukprot:201791-Ditylum_brightwellii.AAC.1
MMNNVQEKIASSSTVIKEHDYETLRMCLKWLLLDMVKCTFACTTQLAMGSLLYLSFRQQHKSRTPQLNILHLYETYATSILFSSETGLGGITCVQLFVGTESKLTKLFRMQTESEGLDAFEDFIKDNGALYALHSNNTKMQI